ncbi:MAG: hypothetical protein ACWA5P_01845 [bacterium]
MKHHKTLEEFLKHFQIYLLQNDLIGSNAYYNGMMYLRAHSLSNSFICIDDIDNETFNKLRGSLSDAEARRILKEKHGSN